MLYRCARRPPRPTHAATLRARFFKRRAAAISRAGRRIHARSTADTRSRCDPRFLGRPSSAAPRHPLARFRAGFPPGAWRDASSGPGASSTQHPPSPRSPAPIPAAPRLARRTLNYGQPALTDAANKVNAQ